MTLEQPLWQQAGEYSARLDRQLIGSIFDGGVVDKAAGGLVVSERGAGANFTVDVAPGICVVPGTSIANQGSYLCVSTATENVTVPAAPGSNSRIDLLVAQVYDSQISGSVDEWVLEIVEGVAAGSPTAPAVPDDALALAQILVSSADASVTDSMITDVRAEARDTSAIDAVRDELADRIRLVKATKTDADFTQSIDEFEDVDADLDITVSASAGDEIGLSVAAKWGDEAYVGNLDFVTRVGGANVNYTGAAGLWMGLNGIESPISGEWLYTVDAADIASGSVTFRLRSAAPTSKTIKVPLRVQAINYGQ